MSIADYAEPMVWFTDLLSFSALPDNIPESQFFSGVSATIARVFFLVGILRTGRGILDGRQPQALTGYRERKIHVMYTWHRQDTIKRVQESGIIVVYLLLRV